MFLVHFPRFYLFFIFLVFFYITEMQILPLQGIRTRFGFSLITTQMKAGNSNVMGIANKEIVFDDFARFVETNVWFINKVDKY